MTSRRDFALGLTAAAIAGPAFAAVNAPPGGSQPAETIQLGRDSAARLTVPVMIGEAGPYRFVVDTGADTSVIAAEVAGALNLAPDHEVMIQGLTGRQVAPTVHAPELGIGPVSLKARPLPIIPRERLEADGLLGMDALRDRRLVFDFRRPSLEVRPASGRSVSRVDWRYVVIDAQERFGRLAVVNARANNTSATVLVDSGSGISIVNPALAARFRQERRWTDIAPEVVLAGVTDHAVTGEGRLLERLRVGGMIFRNVPVIVADLHLFREWDFVDTPAILMGVDMLRLFAKVELDYGRRRLMFRAGVAEGYFA